MSAASLLNLNVDTLFEQHSVPEIDIVQKKIQTVVENKREELRTMVGERYRDLLQAADTIATMQESSSTLIAQVECISQNCRSLNEQQLIGFKTSDATNVLRTRSADKQQSNYFSTMVQIKLLTALPELIWSNIDQERFFTATELFIFSRHVSTGLQLNVSNPLMQALPVARKQWEILKPFHVTIKQCVLGVLEREELCAAKAADCLLSLLLLEKSNVNSVLKTFLQLRSAAFLNSLTDANRAEVAKRRVKERILISLKVLYGTIDLIEKCFLEKGLLLEKLAEHADSSTPPSILLMDSNDRQFAHMLPEIIANFRPKFEAQTLDEVQLRESIDNWLADVTRLANVQLQELFTLVPTMSTIQELKNEAIVWQQADNCAILMNILRSSKSLNFYETTYAPLISQRVRDIVRDSWVKAMDDTWSDLKRTLESTCHDDVTQANAQVQQLWKDSASDLPLSLAIALSEDRKLKKLLMKISGYDDAIISICSNFDKQLSDIVSELNVVLEEQVTKSEDKQALIEFLRDIAQNQLTEFVTKVKSENLMESKRQALLLITRLLAALLELCPHLKICFCQQSSWRQHVGQTTHSSVDSWQRMCLLIEEEIIHIWDLIIKGILEENPCTPIMPKEIGYESILGDFANWETITLEQKDEHDNDVHSSFRIPNQPRISLQSYLFSVVRSINHSIPQTLPPQILKTFNHQLLLQILSYYETLTTSSQNVALQLYFDLKFLVNIFAVTRDNRVVYDRFQALISKLKESIDPFDFELFDEHLSSNIKRSVSKVSCQLGVLVSSSAATVTPSTVPGITQDQDPNVLCLSSNGSTSIWFPLLPIIESDAGTDKSQSVERRYGVESEKQTTPTRKPASNTKKSDSTKSKSGAAAFFGAMSQEWFR